MGDLHMRPLNFVDIGQYSNPMLTDAFIQRAERILNSDIDDLLPENPYLLPAADPTWAGSFVESALHDQLRKAEVDFVDKLLRDLAVFVAERACDGRRSGLPGVDLEFDNEGIHYLIAIRPSAGNMSAAARKRQTRILRRTMAEVAHATKPVLGYCYGRVKTGYTGGCLRVAGPNFWYLISGNPHLYTDIIEMISQRVKACRHALVEQKARASNRMLKQFIIRYCDEHGAYSWDTFVEHNSCDFDLNAFLS